MLSSNSSCTAQSKWVSCSCRTPWIAACGGGYLDGHSRNDVATRNLQLSTVTQYPSSPPNNTTTTDTAKTINIIYPRSLNPPRQNQSTDSLYCTITLRRTPIHYLYLAWPLLTTRDMTSPSPEYLPSLRMMLVTEEHEQRRRPVLPLTFCQSLCLPFFRRK